MTARHYLGIAPGGIKVYRNVRKDETGEPLILIDQDAVAKLQLNFAEWAETGETISDVSATATNCQIVTDDSGYDVTFTISAVTNHVDGSITAIVTFSNGEKWRGIIRVRRHNRYKDEALIFSDYV